MKRKIRNYIAKWERQGYPNGIPDEAPPRLEMAGKVPSYRFICRAILKNDIHLLSLGGSRPHCPLYDAIKREEIRARKG